ncbi:Chromosomal replication initiator, DnaA C-terminal [uncultured Caudovirales phage]|uniref:Chromosomal replication initiator, DnaA C-terminal n=1 Tax=uncultured Caudovirales phage TaxID=2100421 RepID=A0A6J5P2I5_9CAUD|nr:Chromosomal replication initiator, DnaA C-terminal [uncultured Caudovirales phage]
MAKDWKDWIERDKWAEQIINAAAKVSGIPVEVLVGFDRRRKIFRVRALTMLIIREDAGVSWSDIARKFCNRHHTSVIHAVEQARNIELLETYQKILSKIRLEVAALSLDHRPGPDCDICNGPCNHYQA